jgi:tetratricopeptide (TPR) repeat protein
MTMNRLIGLAWLALLACVPAAARAEWKAAETAHFIIYSEGSEKEVDRLATRLEGIDALMRMATALGDAVDPVKVRIYQVGDTDDVDKALGLSNSGIAGFYDSNLLGPFAVTPRSTSGAGVFFSAELVLHHEYAHHFMLQYMPAVYPQWYSEGFAELVGSSKFMPDGRIGYGMPAKHRGSSILADWIPVQEILLTPPHKLYNFDLYGQGWLLTHFLTLSKTRSPQLREYLGRIAAGQPPAEAAKAFGDLSKLNREARTYLDQGTLPYIPVEVKIATPVIQKTRILGPGEAALIPEVIAFRDEDLSVIRKASERERERKLREETLSRIRKKAQRHSADPYSLYLLAEAEYAAGEFARSEAAADRLLAINPGHVRAMARKSINMSHALSQLGGQARSRRAAEARRLAVRANKADTTDALPLVAYYQSFSLANEKVPEVAVEGLQQAVQTVPLDTRVRRLLVNEFAAQKRWREAIAYLMPLANSFHESPQRAAAREQMTAFQAELAKASGAAQTK